MSVRRQYNRYTSLAIGLGPDLSSDNFMVSGSPDAGIAVNVSVIISTKDALSISGPHSNMFCDMFELFWCSWKVIGGLEVVDIWWLMCMWVLDRGWVGGRR